MMMETVFTGEHVVMVWLFGVIGFALRTMPRPQNAWQLWLMGVVQYGFMNLTEGTANIAAARSQGSPDGK
jgi:hypothetical protein